MDCFGKNLLECSDVVEVLNQGILKRMKFLPGGVVVVRSPCGGVSDAPDIAVVILLFDYEDAETRDDNAVDLRAAISVLQ